MNLNGLRACILTPPAAHFVDDTLTAPIDRAAQDPQVFGAVVVVVSVDVVDVEVVYEDAVGLVAQFGRTGTYPTVDGDVPPHEVVALAAVGVVVFP